MEKSHLNTIIDYTEDYSFHFMPLLISPKNFLHFPMRTLADSTKMSPGDIAPIDSTVTATMDSISDQYVHDVNEQLLYIRIQITSLHIKWSLTRPKTTLSARSSYRSTFRLQESYLGLLTAATVFPDRKLEE